MIKSTIKNIFRMAGYDIHRLSAINNSTFQLFQGLRNFNIDLIMDVGANVGQFALALRSVGYTGNIVSFEPLTSAYAELCKVASQDKKWQVYKRCAVGHFDGEIQINIAGNSVSSSILPMAELHRAAAERFWQRLPHTRRHGRAGLYPRHGPGRRTRRRPALHGKSRFVIPT